MFVFVYGTLKRGYSNHDLLEIIEAEFIGKAKTAKPTFDLINLRAFPGLVWGDYFVSGELYDVSDKNIGVIDRLEGHPDFYCRDVIPVSVDDLIVEIEAWAYFINEPEHYHAVPENAENEKVKSWGN